MFELSNDYVFSISKILTDVTSNDTLLARRFFYTALAAYNPRSKEIESGIEESINWVIENDDEYKEMDGVDLAKNREIITIAGIEHFFDRNPRERSFEVSYDSFVSVWSNGTSRSNAHANIKRASETAVSMTYGRTNERVKNGKITKVHEAMPVFSKITIDGMNSVKIQLNSSFMPYLVLLTELFSVGYSKFPISFLSGKKTIASLIMTVFVLRYFFAGKGDTQVLRFDIKSLRRILGCENKYPIFKEFKRSIIDKGVRDIEQSNEDGFTLKIVKSPLDKKGHKITHITFEVTSKELNKKSTLSKEQQDIIHDKQKTNKRAFDKAIEFKSPQNLKSKPLSNKNNDYLDLVKRMTNNT